MNFELYDKVLIAKWIYAGQALSEEPNTKYSIPKTKIWIEATVVDTENRWGVTVQYIDPSDGKTVVKGVPTEHLKPLNNLDNARISQNYAIRALTYIRDKYDFQRVDTESQVHLGIKEVEPEDGYRKYERIGDVEITYKVRVRPMDIHLRLCFMDLKNRFQYV